MADAQLLAMILGKGNLLGIVVRAIIERDSQSDTLLIII